MAVSVNVFPRNGDFPSYLCFLCNEPCDATNEVCLIRRDADVAGAVAQSGPNGDLIPNVDHGLALFLAPPLSLVVSVVVSLLCGLFACGQIGLGIVKIISAG